MTDFANMHVWSEEEDATSTNPICLDDYPEDNFATMELSERKERKTKSDKKKKRRRRKKAAQEDSSVADSVLSSILSEEDLSDDAKLAGKHQMITVDEHVPSPQTKFHEKRVTDKQQRRKQLEDLKTRRIAPKTQVQPMRASLYPSSDEETNDFDGSQFSDRNETTHTVEDDDLSKNPFSDRVVEDDDLSKNPFSDRNETVVEDDDDLSKNPFSEQNRTPVTDDDDLSQNPFVDDSARDRAYSDSDESSTIRPPPRSTYRVEEQNKKEPNTNPFAKDDEESAPYGEQIEVALQEIQEEDDEEDIVESSKRLLRCVDQRIQYQQQTDEVHSMKAEVKQMRVQAEAMAEQLRRAVETKCDLVLAQNEMERNHEQFQIAKDNELHDLRLYIQEILEQQALSEVDFMNEIASLAKTLQTDKKKHAKEVEGKEAKISKLETKIESMKVASVRGVSPESFRERFTKNTGKSMFVFPSFE